MKKIVLLLFSVILLGCNQQNEQASKLQLPKNGIWRGVIALNDSVDLPFNFEIRGAEDDGYDLTIYNAEEKVSTTVTRIGLDSIKITLPVFANYIVARVGLNTLDGSYINPDAEDYVLPFSASFGDSTRFPVDQPKCCSINDKWAVKFRPETDKESSAVAYFKESEGIVVGTFVTETGDDRYLEGTLSGNELKLSAFDGANLYVYHGVVNGQNIEGFRYSGRSSVKPWVAYRDDEFHLRNADSLTYLKEGYKTLEFSFQDLNGSIVSLADERFKNKPVIVQIMGSWCSNCMDESRYLTDIYNKYKSEGLEIVGLTFERTKSEGIALARARKMVEDIQISYPVLLAGSTREERVSDKLPMLNHFMSYPTSIYLNADHSVRSIHTGFAGPGTPLYEAFLANDSILIEEMLGTQPSKQ